MGYVLWDCILPGYNMYHQKKTKLLRNLLEKEIEGSVCKIAKSKGMIPYKFTSPAHASVPDRIFLAPIPKEHREIVGKYIKFIEFKRANMKPTPAQLREHHMIQSLGFEVEVVDNIDSGISVIQEMTHEIN